MAAEDRSSTHDLSELLGRPAADVDFFQLVRWVERRSRAVFEEESALSPEDADASPRVESVGVGAEPEWEVIRFSVRPTLRFPTAPVRTATVQLDVDDSGYRTERLRWNVDVGFTGLVGPQGVLPQHYTELLLERAQDKDTAFRDLIDLIHQRQLGFFYRAWRKHSLPVGIESEQVDEQRPLHGLLTSLAGLGLPGEVEATGLPEAAAILFAGHLGRSVAPAATIEQALGGLLGVPVRIESFCGRWAPVRRRDQGVLGLHADGSQPLGLGAGYVLGSTSWDVTARVRIHIGPIPFEQVPRYDGDRKALGRTISLFRQLAGPATEAEVVLHVERDQSRGTPLGGPPSEHGRLGFSSWLLDEQHPDDTALSAHLGLPEPVGQA